MRYKIVTEDFEEHEVTGSNEVSEAIVLLGLYKLFPDAIEIYRIEETLIYVR